jgi:UDP-galactopyranose mutase
MTIGLAGAGIACAVIARELAEHGHRVELHEQRSHVAGNCHTERDGASGVMLHRWGPHIFHTNDDDVWTCVNRFAMFRAYVHRVKAVVRGRVYALPINLHTINQFAGAAMSPAQARRWVHERCSAASSEPARNFEELALQTVGRDLYEAFFHGYTFKQWGIDPARLPASVMARLPLRFSYDDNYFAHRHQGLPEEGYTTMVERMLDHPLIRVVLRSRLDAADVRHFDHVFSSAPIDAWFGRCFGMLPYRTLDFERIDAIGDFQGCAVLNQCDADVPFTRTTEHAHFAPWERHEATVCFRESSRSATEADTPFYPVHLSEGNTLLARYQALAAQQDRVTFVGRLGTFRYLDMDVTIRHALDAARQFLGRGSAVGAQRVAA